jgi:signal transduction histidine kinase
MEGGGKIAFRGEYHPLEERVALWVSNTGPLIPEEIRSHIFDPFFTTKQPGQGTGLGLSIAQSIVESFHGNLELDAEASLTTFIIRFRLWKEG